MLFSSCFSEIGTMKQFCFVLTILSFLVQQSYTRGGNGDKHPHFSEDCYRPCQDNEPPKLCYYSFEVGYHMTLGPECDVQGPNTTTFRDAPNKCILSDGIEKAVTTYNSLIPGPSIQVCKGDYIVVDVKNEAEGLSTTIHWHGLFQKGSPYYDGVPFVTQCPIQSSNTFRYQFAANNSGTHFYHSHTSTQMIDGLYGSFIVRNPPNKEPHLGLYDVDDAEHVMLISDLFHDLSLEHLPGRYRNNQGQTADNILINGRGRFKNKATNQMTDVPLTYFTVESGKRYRMRLINSFSTVCLAEISIESHPFLLIAQDGENVVPVVVDKIILATGERADFVLTANQSAGSYWIKVRGLGECEEKQIYQVAILKYKGAPDITNKQYPEYAGDLSEGVTYNPLDATGCPNKNPSGSICVNQLDAYDPVDKRLLQVRPDYRIIMPFSFHNFRDGHELSKYDGRFFIAPDSSILTSLVSHISFAEGPAPPLSQREGYERLCNPYDEPTDCTEPCTCTHVYHLKLDSVVEMVIYDEQPLPLMHHPFHLHGYAFSVITMGEFEGNKTFITEAEMEEVIRKYDKGLRRNLYKQPPKKDTLVVPNSGYVIIRFIADNPGWWFFHCHFLWHTVTGMNVVLHVGTPKDVPPVPPGFPKCYNWTPPPNFRKKRFFEN